jgi:hypothetical protein
LVREARDTKTAVSLITQNASDFTRSQHGRDILKNVPCTVFMWHDKVNDGVVDFFNLSSEEAVQLRKLRTGTDVDYSEAIVRAASVLEAKLRITASGQEADIIEHSQQPTPMSDKETQTTVSEYSGDNTESSENGSEPGQTQQETKGEEPEPSNTGAQDVDVTATSTVETATETQEEAPDEADDWLLNALDVDDYDKISSIDIWRAEDLHGTPLPPTIDGFNIGSTSADVVPAADASARAVYKSPLGDLYRVTYTTVPDDVSPDTILERLRIDLVYSGDDELWGVQIPRDGDTETAIALLQKVTDQTVTSSTLEEVSR